MTTKSGAWLVGEGEMADRIRAFNWADHPLGDMDQWPDTLRIVLGLALGSNLPTAIYWGSELHLLYNDAWMTVPRDRHPKALGQRASEVWPDIYDVVGPQFDSVMNDAAAVTSFDQLLAIERNGLAEETYWNYTLSPITGPDGQVLGIFNQGYETTAAVLAAREGAAEMDRLRDLFAQAPGAIAVVKGPDHVFEIANAAYLDLIGERDPVFGRAVSEVIPEVLAQGFVDLLDTVYNTGEPYVGSEVPIELVREGKREARVLDFVYQPTRDAAGKVNGIFVEAWDVTDRSQLLDELRELTRTLEERVQSEVSKKLAAEDKLNQAQRLEAIGQLTGGIAHDFNNMLAVILSALNLLRRKLGSQDPDRDRLIDAAEDAAHRAARLTQQLLAFARKQSLEPGRLSPSELLGSMIELVRRTLGEQIIVEFEDDASSWDIMVDAAQLENAILNLAINARDAMPDGGKLRLSVANCEIDQAEAAALDIAPGDYACIAVEDTGSGMAADVAERAFDPFFTTKDVGKGTGLGLSQVIGFIQQSNGQISLDSEPGQGTSIRLILPRCIEGLEKANARVNADGVQPGNGERILVVEDNDRLRGFTEEVLRDIGYTVDAAQSGDEALNLIETGTRPDLILTDIIMPGLSGVDLASRVRAQDAGTKIIFMSGYAHDKDQESETLTGNELIKKPFTIEDLSAKIAMSLHGDGQ
jgi:signal transduction histidine kinase/CheY-like chemotaxis protein